jgi:hypothetical protein
VPLGASVSPITVYFTGDNGVTAYFNGTKIGDTSVDVGTYDPVPSPLPSVFANTYSAIFTPVAGQTNTLAFVVRNSQFPVTVNPTGLLYSAQGQYCQPNTPSTLKVHILKYLDGVQADATSASGYQFPMTATWNALNIGAGTGNYVLGNNFGGAVDLYGADTASMSVPADYTTSEVTGGGSQVLASLDQCVPGDYVLNGYRTSTVSFADAATQSLSLIAPVFVGLTGDQYVIVDNSKCPTPTTGSISGMKYNDLNRNGKKDAGEPGLPGWTIRLINGNTVVTTTTDANGNYTFPNLTPGTYKVREVHKNGWKRMSKNPKSIVIIAGSVVTGVDFGNAQKHKGEKEDTNEDDNHNDQSGNYHPGHGHSNYQNN